MKKVRVLGILSSCAIAACSGASTSAPPSDDAELTVATPVPAVQTLDTAVQLGQVTGSDVAAHPKPLTTSPAEKLLFSRIQDKVEKLAQVPQTANPPPVNPPSANPSNIASSSRNAFGFPGLTIVDSDTATGQEGVTPPDQALCEGNGFVLEGVNLAFAVYDINGDELQGPINPAQFFAFPPNPDTSHSSFPSDPKCYFDQDTGRFFATMLRLPVTVDPTTGQIVSIDGSFLHVAVSTTGDPRGTWNEYSIDLTDDGTDNTPDHPNCPCLGDQPLIGADTNGFYATTNEFSLGGIGFNGAQIYALDKKALVGGTLPTVVHLANLPLADNIATSIQPATSPSGKGDSAGGGTEYFLSGFESLLDNRIALWALSNTKTLAAANPEVKLEHAVLASETYGFPPPAAQQPGPTPLGSCLSAGTCTDFPGTTVPASLEQLDTNDDRMNQVVFAHGQLFGALNTVLQVGQEQRAGVAWFGVEAKHLHDGQVGGKVREQGYVALAGNDVLYPSIALRDDGTGAMTFSVSGSGFFPSAAFVNFSISKGPGDVHVVGPGAAPLDDSDGYFNGGAARFGDYSAALVDGSTLWMASEWVPVSCTSLPCAGRDDFANWGTFVARVDLDDTLDQ
jgi:hypothetical protein